MITNLTKEAFEQLLRRLPEIQRKAISEAAIAAVPAIQKELSSSFDDQKSPANQAWEPLKDPRQQFRPILQGLKEYTQTGISGEGKVYSTNQKYYAKYHQTGTRYLPARRFLPVSGEDVPQWEKNVSAPIYQHITNLLRGQ